MEEERLNISTLPLEIEETDKRNSELEERLNALIRCVMILT
jgi:hypothetical protein